MRDSSRVLGDDFRVCIASRDLPELMSQERLTRELSSRLGYQVKVGWDKGQVVWYAPSAGSADEIAQVACEVLELEVLARHDIGRWQRAPVWTERWSPRAKVWRDVTVKPSADIAADKQAREHEARQERERQTSVKFGIAYWQVLVKLSSHRDVVALAGHFPPRDGGSTRTAGPSSWGRTAKTTLRASPRRSPVTTSCCGYGLGVRRVEAIWSLDFEPRLSLSRCLRVLWPSRPTWFSPFDIRHQPTLRAIVSAQFQLSRPANSQVIAPHHRLRPNLVPSQVARRGRPSG